MKSLLLDDVMGILEIIFGVSILVKFKVVTQWYIDYASRRLEKYGMGGFRGMSILGAYLWFFLAGIGLIGVGIQTLLHKNN